MNKLKSKPDNSVLGFGKNLNQCRHGSAESYGRHINVAVSETTQNACSGNISVLRKFLLNRGPHQSRPRRKTLRTSVTQQPRSQGMVETLFKEISDCLVCGEEVKLAGFGVFNMRDKPERRHLHWRQRKKRTFTRPDLTTASELPFVRNEGQFRSRDIPSRWGRRLAQLRSRCFRFPKT